MSRARKRKPDVTLADVPPRLRGILQAVPCRNELFLKWEKDEKGLVSVTHAKDLGRLERWLMKKVGGSPTIRRKLDGPGSDIWVLCDGEHTVADLCHRMDLKYKEKIEPVLTRVVRFLEILLARNLIFLKAGKAGDRPPALAGGLLSDEGHGAAKAPEARPKKRKERESAGGKGK